MCLGFWTMDRLGVLSVAAGSGLGSDGITTRAALAAWHRHDINFQKMKTPVSGRAQLEGASMPSDIF
jgi:predicted flap endonuclease-1-like 5' DNA nuclease